MTSAWLVRQALSIASAFPRPESIALSEREKVRQRRFFRVFLYDADDGRYVLDYVTSKGVRVRYYKGKADDTPKEVTIPDQQLPAMRMMAEQYLGELEIRYDSPLELVALNWLGIPYLMLAWSKLTGSIMRRRKLVRGDRMSVLRMFLEKTLKDSKYSGSVVSVMLHFYGPRVYDDHPQRDELENYHSLLLASLLKSGDLKYWDGNYSITSDAINTLTAFEVEERRHSDNRARQTAMNWLTAILAIVGALQVAHDYFHWEWPVPKSTDASSSMPVDPSGR